MIGESGENLVFLLGLPRSGTTLLCAMLDNHPQIHCPPEPWLMLALESLGKVSHRHPAESHALGEAVREFLSGEVAIRSARSHAITAYNHHLAARGKAVLVDKTPRYFLAIEYLQRLMPQAKYIWLARNPFAIAASYKSSWGISVADTLADGRDSIVGIDLLIGLNRLMAFAKANQLAPVRYEELVRDPDAVLRGVLSQIGLSWASGLTAFDVRRSGLGRAYAGDKKIIETHRPHTQSLDSWRTELSADEKQLLLDAIGTEVLHELGYGEVETQLADEGIVVRDPAASARWLAKVEAMLAARRADVDAVSQGYRLLRDPAEMTRELEKAAADLAVARRVHDERVAQLHHLELTINTLRKQLDVTTAEVNRLNQIQAEDRTTPLQQKIDELETKIAALVQLTVQVQLEAADTINQRVHFAQMEISAHQAARTAALDELAALSVSTQAEREAHALQIESLRDSIASLTLLAVQTQQEFADQLSVLRATSEANTNAMLAAHASEIASVSSALEGEKASHAEVRSKLATTQAELATARQANQGLQAKLHDLEHQRMSVVVANFFRRVVLAVMLGPYSRTPRVRQLPKITLVTPCFNSADTIRQTIESVLSQGYPNLEYIVVDGGSTDSTAQIVMEYAGRITRFISEKDNGMYDAVAKGLDASTGEILGYINADDLLEPGGLHRVGEYFLDHPRAKVIQHEDTVDFDGWRFPNNPQPKVDHIAILKGHILFQDGVFYRREAYFGVGGFNRLMKRAGDWEMWARLSRPFSVVNRPGHVSCFRIRKGQLSQDLAAYYAEIEAQRPALRAALGTPGVIYQHLRHYTNRLVNLIRRYVWRRPLFFPLKTSGAGLGYQAPDGRAPASAVCGDGSSAPRCPLTSARPDSFLFSSRDTRFGDDLINHVYHCSDTDIAVVHPPLSREELNVLYEKYYSNPHKQIIPTQTGRYSPYQKYRGGSWLMKLLCRIQLPIKITGKIAWHDSTYEQLLEAVGDTFRPKGQKLRFLDVGCFEGALLDRVAQSTDWETFGLEPNAHAVAKCVAKGHRVWQGFADDASYVVPAGETFDLIYLGQTIEHLSDPLTVTRRLRDLLRPGGLLVMSTPNLRAMQIELFGPTWAHWHVPYHRNLFSERSLRQMAELANLQVVASRHYCHPYWTCLSVAQNDLGLGAVVSHAVDFSTVVPSVVSRALSLTFWNNLLYNWRGKGDFMFMVMRKPI